MSVAATPPGSSSPVSVRTVVTAWWPLAASWLLMGLELPAVSAVMARLPHSTESLAAYGGIVFPLALMIEGPIIMLLSASTALSKDWASYILVRRFMFAAAGALTLLHIAVAFTPLYYVVVRGLMHAPPEILEPAHIGLRIMTPWTLSIAFRRTQQGVMIRVGRSWAVSVGTLARLIANLTVLGLGMWSQRFAGIVVGTAAVAAGVMSEALVSWLLVQPVLHELRAAPPVTPRLTMRAFLRFYTPLAATPLIGFFAMPLASAAMGRMPRTLESLAAWPVVNGLTFTVRSAGFAFNEVVVALLERPQATRALRRFAYALAAFTSCILLVLALTPLGHIWFVEVSALPANLVELARVALLLSLAAPAFSVLQSWYQGAIVHSRATRGVTESMVVYLVSIAVMLGIGVLTGRTVGLWIAVSALVWGNGAQVAWLWFRARGSLATMARRDRAARESAA